MELTIIVVVLWIAAVCVHEFGHAITAYIAGDKSVKERGYLTLNPIVYFSSATTLVLPILILLIGGIPLPGAAVYINHGAIKSRIWQSLVSLAGPVFSALCLILFVVAYYLMPSLSAGLDPRLHDTIYGALSLLVYLQVYVIIINLLPLPPLDGYGVIEPWLPTGIRREIAAKANIGFFILILLFWYCKPFARAIQGLAVFLTLLLGVDLREVSHGLDQLTENSLPLVGLMLVAWIIRARMAPPAEKADKLVNEGKPAEALPIYDKLIEEDPKNSKALIASSSCLLSLGQAEKGLERLDKAIKLAPKDFKAWAIQAACYAELGRHEEATASAHEAINLDSQQQTAFPNLILAISLAELKRFDEALKSVNKYLEKEPESSQALFVKGSIFEELERYDEALETYTKAARSRDGHIRGCIARGLLLSALERTDEGLAEFQKVLPAEPSIRAEELAKLKTLINESATRYDALGRHEQAGRLREAVLKIG